MTRAEMAEVLMVKESYLRSRWADIQKAYAETNIMLYKRGRGANADYGISWFGKPIVWTKEEAIRWL